MENRKGSGIFLGVIGVATLIVAIIGATFAYFSATASSNNDAITAGSSTLSLTYEDSSNLKTHLIPALSKISRYAALNQAGTGSTAGNQCIDDHANEVCSYYTFTVGNPTASAIDVTATMKIQENEFENLFFRVYRVDGPEGSQTNTEVIKPTNFKSGVVFDYTDEDEDITLETTCTSSTLGCKVQYVVEEGETTSLKLLALDQQLAPSQEVTYKVVIWIEETGNNQTEADAGEDGKTFVAGITFSTGDGNGVTGAIAAAELSS